MVGTLVSGGNVRPETKFDQPVPAIQMRHARREQAKLFGLGISMLAIPGFFTLIGIITLPVALNGNIHPNIVATAQALHVSVPNQDTLENASGGPMMLGMGIAGLIAASAFIAIAFLGAPKRLTDPALALAAIFAIAGCGYGLITAYSSGGVNVNSVVNTWGETHLHIADIAQVNIPDTGQQQTISIQNDKGTVTTYSISREADTPGRINYTYHVGK